MTSTGWGRPPAGARGAAKALPQRQKTTAATANELLIGSSGSRRQGRSPLPRIGATSTGQSFLSRLLRGQCPSGYSTTIPTCLAFFSGSTSFRRASWDWDMPFVFATVYSEAAAPDYANGPRWEQPFKPVELVKALPGLICTKRSYSPV